VKRKINKNSYLEEHEFHALHHAGLPHGTNLTKKKKLEYFSAKASQFGTMPSKPNYSIKKKTQPHHKYEN
jgi:hypothetical protein